MQTKWYMIIFIIVLAVVISIVGIFIGNSAKKDNVVLNEQVDENIINQESELPDDYTVGQQIMFTGDYSLRTVEEGNIGKIKKEINIDLDGNGKREKIIFEAMTNLEEEQKEKFTKVPDKSDTVVTFRYNQFRVIVQNGQNEYVITPLEEGIELCSDTYFEVIDINKDDKAKEILIYEKFPLKNCVYTLIKYDENGAGIIDRGNCDSIEIKGDKYVKIGKRYAELYIDGVFYNYKYDDNKKLTLMSGEISEKLVGAKYVGEAKINPIKNISNIEIIDQDEAQITEIYEKEWVKVKKKDGNEYWVYYTQLAQK